MPYTYNQYDSRGNGRMRGINIPNVPVRVAPRHPEAPNGSFDWARGEAELFGALIHDLGLAVSAHKEAPNDDRLRQKAQRMWWVLALVLRYGYQPERGRDERRLDWEFPDELWVGTTRLFREDEHARGIHVDMGRSPSGSKSGRGLAVPLGPCFVRDDVPGRENEYVAVKVCEDEDDHVVEWAIQVVQEWRRLLGMAATTASRSRNETHAVKLRAKQKSATAILVDGVVTFTWIDNGVYYLLFELKKYCLFKKADIKQNIAQARLQISAVQPSQPSQPSVEDDDAALKFLEEDLGATPSARIAGALAVLRKSVDARVQR
ncbi:hypothetical protein HDU89_008768 [Geranomyces variabilis]|nr:hypothetical protein HDU89_008768 [Geranomyces variabilis]